MSERDRPPELSSVEAAGLEELGALRESNPGLYTQILSDTVAAAEREEQAQSLLSMFENVAERRQEQDQALLDLIFPVKHDPEPREPDES